MKRSLGRLAARPLVVDMHTHFLPLQWPDFAAKFGGEEWPWMRPQLEGDPKRAMLMQGSTEFRPVHYACWDMAKRLEDMDRDGVDHQILSATPILFQWHRPAAEGLAVAQHFNDAALEMCAQGGPERFSALCQVPLQDIDLACQEVSRARDSGHVGVQIGNHHGTQDLDFPALVTFLNHCAAEGVPVLGKFFFLVPVPCCRLPCSPSHPLDALDAPSLPSSCESSIPSHLITH